MYIYFPSYIFTSPSVLHRVSIVAGEFWKNSSDHTHVLFKCDTHCTTCFGMRERNLLGGRLYVQHFFGSTELSIRTLHSRDRSVLARSRPHQNDKTLIIISMLKTPKSWNTKGQWMAPLALLATLSWAVNSALAFSAASPILAPFEIDTAEAFAASTFPIPPDDLIVRAKQILSDDIKLGLNDGGECLAEDFQFCAAVIGPFGKEEYLELLQLLDLEGYFNITQNMFGFTVSPIQPNRVYFFNHQVAKLKANFLGCDPREEDG